MSRAFFLLRPVLISSSSLQKVPSMKREVCSLRRAFAHS